MLIIAILFFTFGFVTWINSILIPYFKICFSLNHLQSYLVTFAFYISYLVMSIPSSVLLEKVGFKKGMMIGFFCMATGAFMFVPAAIFYNYNVFLAGLFTLGTGLAILQTAANPYVTILGPASSAARRFSVVGICNKFAGVLAPLLFAAVVLKNTDSKLIEQIGFMASADKLIALKALLARVIVPYGCVGVILLGLGFLVRYSPLPEIDIKKLDNPAVTSTKTNILQFPHLILGALAIFLHVGSQVIAVDTIIGYAQSMGINLINARSFPSYTLTATIIGYLLGITLVPKYISQLFALQVCTVLGLCFTVAIIYTHGQVKFLNHQADISIWFIVLLGFANSMIWAGIWPLALDGLGRFIKIGSSILIMGLSGNAILPLVYGYMADVSSLKSAYTVLVPCYLYLFFYAYKGHKIKSWKKQAKFNIRHDA